MKFLDPPQEQLKQIIKENKLVDAAEIADLEMLLEQVKPKLNNQAMDWIKSDLEGYRREQVLTKILSWLK